LSRADYRDAKLRKRKQTSSKNVSLDLALQEWGALYGGSDEI